MPKEFNYAFILHRIVEPRGAKKRCEGLRQKERGNYEVKGGRNLARKTQKDLEGEESE